MERKNKIIIDTGFFVALFSKSDRYHKQALSCQTKIKNRSWITTWPVLTETGHLLGGKHSKQFIGLLTLIASHNIQIFNLEISHIPQLCNMLIKYRNLPMDLADASLVLLAEELNCGDILSTDQRDFGVYRFKNQKPFHNLLT